MRRRPSAAIRRAGFRGGAVPSAGAAAVEALYVWPGADAADFGAGIGTTTSGSIALSYVASAPFNLLRMTLSSFVGTILFPLTTIAVPRRYRALITILDDTTTAALNDELIWGSTNGLDGASLYGVVYANRRNSDTGNLRSIEAGALTASNTTSARRHGVAVDYHESEINLAGTDLGATPDGFISVLGVNSGGEGADSVTLTGAGDMSGEDLTTFGIGYTVAAAETGVLDIGGLAILPHPQDLT